MPRLAITLADAAWICFTADNVNPTRLMPNASSLPLVCNSCATRRRTSRGAICLLAVIVGAFFFQHGAFAAAIAQEGFGIIGLNTAIDSTLGTPFEHAGVASNINDGNLSSSVDTFNAPGTEGFSYAGIIFPAPRTDLVGNLTLTTAAFFDGGWFGPNGTGPGAQQTLTAPFLLDPTLQITFDGGNTWVDAPFTSNYVSQVAGTVLPVAFGFPSRARTATFNLTAPQLGIDGIRVIGREGGTASNGFIGVFEIGVETIPEPSTALVVASGAALLGAFRRCRPLRT
jgi:hypothetical protein